MAGSASHALLDGALMGRNASYNLLDAFYSPLNASNNPLNSSYNPLDEDGRLFDYEHRYR